MFTTGSQSPKLLKTTSILARDIALGSANSLPIAKCPGIDRSKGVLEHSGL